MLHLLVDTSTWLDLSKRRDGQRWIVAIRVLVHQGALELLVPSVVIDEYERNRARVEASMTASIEQRFKLIKQDLDEVPLIGAMTTRNFDEVLDLLRAGRTVEATDDDRRRVVERGLSKQAPFHPSRNSVADALLIELFASQTRTADLSTEPHAFVTSNSDDFSLPNGDRRQPHGDLAVLFASQGTDYGLGVDGLNGILLDNFDEELTELFLETDFQEEPRRLVAISAAEQELFDRIWYHRSLQHEYRLLNEGRVEEAERDARIGRAGRERVEAKYTEPGQLGPYTDFEFGMLNGKLSALRWVLGAEWDFLDT